MDEEEEVLVHKISRLLDYNRIDDALALVTPEMAAAGRIHWTNIIAYFCHNETICNDLEQVKHIIAVLLNKGYKYNKDTHSFRWYADKPRALNLILIASGLCKCIETQTKLAGRLMRVTLDLFFDHGCVLSRVGFDAFLHKKNYEFEAYVAVHKYRENARSASIALIKVGKQRRAVDVMRLVSRLVWGRRMDKEWEYSQSFSAKRRAI